MKNTRPGKPNLHSLRNQSLKTKSLRTSVKTEDHKVKWFNIIFGLLLIGGMLLSALGGRSRVSRGVSTASTVSPASVAFTWQRQSSNGACEQVTTYVNGHFQNGPCGNTSRDQVLKTTAAQQVRSWVSTLQAFSYIPPTQDGKSSIELAFTGSGKRTATAEEQQAIESLAEQLALQN